MCIERTINFTNPKDGIKLAGTLSFPQTQEKCPGVILVSGSGPQNRDQNIMGHKMFKDIARYLSNKGIAVLRLDDRGVGKSEGVFKSARLQDFKNDIQSAYSFLKEISQIDSGSIGFLGHSIGGLVACMAASELQSQVAFVVSMAGPGMVGRELYIKQHELISQKQGLTSIAIKKNANFIKQICDLILKIEDEKELIYRIRKLFQEKKQFNSIIEKWIFSIRNNIHYHLYKANYQTYTQPWFREWLQINPSTYCSKVECPVLAISGSKDLQVPVENLDLLKAHIRKGGNEKLLTKSFENLNHIFQVSETGLPEEYGKSKSGITAEVLEFVANWIKKTLSASKPEKEIEL